jgi:copper transport protein
VKTSPARLLVGAAIGALGACLVLAAGAQPASAHALLRASTPAANSSLAKSPTQIVLTFTEPPDWSLSLVRVVDSTGRAAPGVGQLQPIRGEPLELLVPVKRPLRKGVYTVNWRTVSRTDGHVTDGAFAFGVGAAAGPSSVVKVSLLNTSPLISAGAIVGRWLLYVGLALLVGAASTLLLVFDGWLPRGALWLLRVAVALAALGAVVLIETERVVVGVLSLLPLFVTQEGLFLLALFTAVALCGVAVGAVDIYPKHRLSLLAVGITGVLAMFVHVLAGHAGTPSMLRPLNIFDQWIHMTAVGVWIGGLVWLLFALRDRERAQWPAAIRAFSRIATVTLVVVLASGLVRSLEEVHPLTNLLHTSYGLTLVVKVALVAVLVLFAAFNHYRFVPALAGAGSLGGAAGSDDQAADVEAGNHGKARARRSAGARHAAGRHIILDSRAELAVAIGVLVATAVLSGLAPANVSSTNGAPQTVVSGSDFGTTVRVTLSVSPGTVGKNDFTVDVDDYDTGKQLTAVSTVTLSFALPSRPDVNPSQLSLRRASTGNWKGSGLELSVVGSWRVTVLVQQPTRGVDVALMVHVAK